MKNVKRLFCIIMVAVMMVMVVPSTSEAASKVQLNKKKVTLTITNKKKNPAVTLKVKGVSKKIARKAKWTTSNKKVAVVKKGKVTAKKAGKAVITCKVRGKKYKCRVTVLNKRKSAKNGTLNVTIAEKASETGLGPLLPRYLSDKVMQDFATVTDLKLDDKNQVPGGGDPYTVNKIKVTYNGKDVTDKAEYKIDKTQIARVTSPGTIELTNRGMFFNLTVSYNGMEKTVKMAKTPVKYQHIICYCGTVIPCPEDVYDCSNCVGDASCPYCKHFDIYHCGGCWTVDFMRYIDLRIK